MADSVFFWVLLSAISLFLLYAVYRPAIKMGHVERPPMIISYFVIPIVRIVHMVVDTIFQTVILIPLLLYTAVTYLIFRVVLRYLRSATTWLFGAMIWLFRAMILVIDEERAKTTSGRCYKNFMGTLGNWVEQNLRLDTASHSSNPSATHGD